MLFEAQEATEPASICCLNALCCICFLKALCSIYCLMALCGICSKRKRSPKAAALLYGFCNVANAGEEVDGQAKRIFLEETRNGSKALLL